MSNELEWLAPWRDDETITIQRAVYKGNKPHNILISATVRKNSTLGSEAATLRLLVNRWGESSYADERVARQAESITRLLDRLQEAHSLLNQVDWSGTNAAIAPAVRKWMEQSDAH